MCISHTHPKSQASSPDSPSPSSSQLLLGPSNPSSLSLQPLASGFWKMHTWDPLQTHPSRGVLTHLGVSSPVSGCPHPSQRVLTCLGVSSPVSACPHPSRHVVSLPFSRCPHPSWRVLTRLGVSSPVLAYPLLLLSSAGTLSTCPQRRQGVPRGSTKRQMRNDPFFLPKQTLEVSSEMNILRHKSRFC